MIARTLQILGVLTILALVGGAVAGFGVLKDRVRVVVQDDDADAGPDPTALLRDEVQQLTGDVRTLQQAIVQNFGQLASGLEAGAETRHADVQALRRQVDELGEGMQQLQRSLVDVDTRVAALQLAPPPAAPATSPQTSVATTTPIATGADGPQAAQRDQPAAAGTAQPQPSPPPVAAGDPDAAPDPEPAATPSEPAAQPAQRSFLSFSLPASGFAFDQPQDYALLPQLSRVGFDAKSTLHDFSGVTSQLEGGFRADFDDPEGLCTGEVVVQASSLKTGVEGRDSNMYEHLDTAHHGELRFEIQRFAAAPDGVDTAARTARGEVEGRMTIRGKTRPFAMPVTIEVDPQQRVVVTGQQKLKLTDYDVPVPSQLGLISMQDEVVVWIALRARAQPRAAAAAGPGRGQ